MEDTVVDPMSGEEVVQIVKVPQTALEQLKASVKIDVTPKGVYDRFAQEQTIENLLLNGMFSAERVSEFKAYVDALDDDSVAPKMKLEQIVDNIQDEQKRIAMIEARAQMIQQRANKFLYGDPDEQASLMADAQMQLMNQPIEGEAEVIQDEEEFAEPAF
jgi:Glu-tRNA(Gln) amidotransferase subunit E-like FAD-binding protein